jgi:3-oxoacyl-[acyl-carrier protein] reductase
LYDGMTRKTFRKKSYTMVLKNKNALIYGAGGSLGNAIAKAFAAAGANVFLSGHNLASVQKTADEILVLGKVAEVDQVDALDAQAVNSYIARIAERAGTVDISFNAIGIYVKQNVPLVDLTPDEFVQPIAKTMHTQFLTSTAAGRIMMKQGSGMILSLTATPGGIGYPYTGGFAPSCCALESFSRNLASELGVYGVRVVNIRSGGSPDSRTFQTAMDSSPEVIGPVFRQMEEDTMLKKLPLVADIASAAVFLSSDLAGKITGVTIDITSGTTAALNYRVPRETANR